MTKLLQEAALLAEQSGIRHGFSTRHGGVSTGLFTALNCGWTSGDALENVRENRRRVAAAVGVGEDKLITCNQVHSPTVMTVTAPWTMDERPEADAMVTNQPDIALGILTADCVPLLLADPVARVIGAAHAGWRGALAGVVENTVMAMRTLGAQPERMVAALGPCIGQDYYEVGPTFPAPFLVQNSGYARFFRPAERSDHYMFDLPGMVQERLRRAGVSQTVPPLADTYAAPADYFSYRRKTHNGESQMGSLLAVIVL